MKQEELIKKLDITKRLELKFDIIINGVNLEFYKLGVLLFSWMYGVMLFSSGNPQGFMKFMWVGVLAYFIAGFIEKMVNHYLENKMIKEFLEKNKVEE